ncbi:hypothetical protein ASE59_13930, partial [Sphingomonas sp. Leaf10]
MIAAALLATAAPLTVPLDAACVVGTDPAAQVLRERLVERGAVCPLPSPKASPQRRLGSPAAPAAPDNREIPASAGMTQVVIRFTPVNLVQRGMRLSHPWKGGVGGGSAREGTSRPPQAPPP